MSIEVERQLRARNEVLEANLADAQRRAELWKTAHWEHCRCGISCAYRDDAWVERQLIEQEDA